MLSTGLWMRVLLCVMSLMVTLELSARAGDKDMVRRERSEAQLRVALVVGNGRYEHISSLQGPPNDAEVVARSLRAVGFEVQLEKNLDNRAFAMALADFAQRATGADVALVYYSGHGLQVDGENYLVPVDADIRSPAYIRADAVALGDLLARMDYSGAQTRIVVLDACRNNPFSSRWYTQEKGSTQSGLAQVNATGGFFIAYATAPGSVAQDAEQGAGLYATAFASALSVPGEELNTVFRHVGASVQARTGGRQVPWISSSLTVPFYFLPPEESAIITDSTRTLEATPSLSADPANMPGMVGLQMGIGFEWSINDPFLWNRGVRVSAGLDVRRIFALEIAGTYYSSVTSDGDLTPLSRFLIDDAHLAPDFSRLLYRGGIAMRFMPIEGHLRGSRTFVGVSVGVGMVRTEDDAEAAQADASDERFAASQAEFHGAQSMGIQGGLDIGLIRVSSQVEVACYLETVAATILEHKCPIFFGLQLGVHP